MEKINSFEIANKDKVFGLLSFGISSFLFLLSGAMLQMNPVYLILTVFITTASVVSKRSLVSFLAFAPFIYSLWTIGIISSGDIFLFIIGFVCSFVFLFQFSASLGRETDLVISYGSGIIFSFLLTILTAMKYQLFSSLFTVSPIGVFLIIIIIFFFRIQYYLWKGK